MLVVVLDADVRPSGAVAHWIRPACHRGGGDGGGGCLQFNWSLQINWSCNPPASEVPRGVRC